MLCLGGFTNLGLSSLLVENLKLVIVWFHCLAEWLPPLVWGCSMILSSRIKKGDLNNVITTEGHQGAIHFWSYHVDSQRMPVWTPNSLAHACGTQAKARVFSCLLAQKSHGPEVLVWNRKSARQSSLNLGGASHHPKALCWARGSLNDTTCHWACWRASELPRPSLIRWVPINTIPLGFSSFHQWG